MRVDHVEQSAFRLRDGRAARVRRTTVADAEAVLAMDRALADDGRGMVVAPEQVRSVDEERRRIDAVYAAMAAGQATLSVVAETVDDGCVVGSADLRQLAPARCLHVGLLSVGVAPAFQRLGVARAMMEFLVEHARMCGLLRLELYVRADNDRAQALYRSLGFAHEGTRARFIRARDGSFVDDHIFVRFLDGPTMAASLADNHVRPRRG